LANSHLGDVLRVAVSLGTGIALYRLRFYEENPMLRITVVSQTPEEVALKVEGWMCGANVGLLEQEGGRYLEEAGRLVLDLKGVQNIDEEGMALLQRWSGKGLKLCGGSLFVQALLNRYGL